MLPPNIRIKDAYYFGPTYGFYGYMPGSGSVLQPPPDPPRWYPLPTPIPAKGYALNERTGNSYRLLKVRMKVALQHGANHFLGEYGTNQINCRMFFIRYTGDLALNISEVYPYPEQIALANSDIETINYLPNEVVGSNELLPPQDPPVVNNTRPISILLDEMLQCTSNFDVFITNEEPSRTRTLSSGSATYYEFQVNINENVTLYDEIPDVRYGIFIQTGSGANIYQLISVHQRIYYME